MRTDGPGQSARLMLDVAALLMGEKVDYAVIGAMAASVYGAVRASLDADAVLPVSPAQLDDLEKRFRAAGLGTELRRGDSADPIRALLMLTDSHGNRVDLLAGLGGLDRDAFARTLDVPFEGGSLRVIGLEDFIAMKLFAGGPVDLDDARRVTSVSAGSVDLVLLRRLTERYGDSALRNLDALLSE